MDHERLRQLMKVKNISQKQACQDLGISQQRLSSYMLGKREPDDEIKKQIAQYLDTTIDFQDIHYLFFLSPLKKNCISRIILFYYQKVFYNLNLKL